MQTKNQFILFPLYLLVNLFPLYGTMKENWSIFYLIYIYWLELIIITLITVAKILMAEGDSTLNQAEKNAIGMKFLVIRGGMFFVYLVGLLFILGAAMTSMFNSNSSIFSQILTVLTPPTSFYWFTILNFIGYNLIDFWLSYISNGLYKTSKPNDFTNILDSHIVVIHIFLIFGTMIYLYITQKLGYSQHKGLIASISFFIFLKLLVNTPFLSKSKNSTK